MSRLQYAGVSEQQRIYCRSGAGVVPVRVMTKIQGIVLLLSPMYGDEIAKITVSIDVFFRGYATNMISIGRVSQLKN